MLDSMCNDHHFHFHYWTLKWWKKSKVQSSQVCAKKHTSALHASLLQAGHSDKCCAPIIIDEVPLHNPTLSNGSPLHLSNTQQQHGGTGRTHIWTYSSRACAYRSAMCRHLVRCAFLCACVWRTSYSCLRTTWGMINVWWLYWFI